ncbi:MAG: hypothetical protein ACLGH0_10560, partial [Thermoanaerobaculia bacterium]
MRTIRRRRRGERGAALVLVIFASTLILLLLMTMHVMTWTSGRVIVRQLQTQGQATSAASAGLTDALSWFVHQRTQPVTAFDPKADTGGVCTHVPPHVPLVYESDEPATGIVRSFEIAGNGRLWGRYDVRRSAVRDISTRRGKSVSGAIWQLDSEGIIYVRNDASKPPGEAPNRILARRTMRVDIQRLAIQLPANAALSATQGRNIRVLAPSRIQGGSTGIGAAYRPSTGTPTGNGTISGNPARNTTSGAFALDSVFGVTQNELLAMADLVVDDERQLPNPLPDMSLIVVRNNATFSPTRKLRGSGILVVLGNLILNPQSDAYYSGLIWVGGTFTVAPPGIINGSVIVNGNAVISGGSEVAEINYDAAMLDQVRLQMGNYLFSRPPWIVER